MRRLLPALFLSLAALSPFAAEAASSPDATVSSAAALPVRAFLDLDAFDSIKISPDGRYFAATVPLEGKMMLVFLRREDMKQTGGVTLGEDAEIDDFVWVNPGQVVYSAREKNGSLARPKANPYLYLANADGSEGRAVNRTRMMYLVDELRDDDDHLLVGPGLYKIRLKDGDIVERMGKPSPLSDEWQYPDNRGYGRIATGNRANEVDTSLYARIGPAGDDSDPWRPIVVPLEDGIAASFLGFSADDATAYLQITELRGPDSVYALDMKTGKRTLVHRDPRVDPYDVLTSPVTGGVVAIVYLDGRPKLHFVAPQDPHAKELQKMAPAFPDSFVYPTSYSKDGTLAVYSVSSDVNSGEFYLVDHAKGKADYLAEKQKAMLPDLMSPMEPFRFEARDGLVLDGFLTRPRGLAAGQPAPLVVIPHGGPKYIYDTWGFDPEVQLLASRGYAVIQVNFRGSGNQGESFADLGNGEWGTGMVEDVIDATRWAIGKGVATAGRVCMYGASYGAYAALTAVAKEPSLYACAIGNVGVYDIGRMYTEDTRNSRNSQVYFDELFGKRADLEAISPTRFAARIRVPVLLGAGEEDRIAPPDQTDQMLRQLRAAGADVQHVEYEDEAHGNYLLKNREDWANRVLAMLDRTIGARGTAAAPAAAAPATATAASGDTASDAAPAEQGGATATGAADEG